MVDALNLLLLKFIALFTDHAVLVTSLFGLSTYLLTTCTTLLAMRRFEISYSVARGSIGAPTRYDGVAAP